MDPWEPDLRLPVYNGPYPVRELQQARVVLVHELGVTTRDALEKIKPKIGIPSRFGKPLPLKPPEIMSPPKNTLESLVDQNGIKESFLQPVRKEIPATVTSGSQVPSTSGIQSDVSSHGKRKGSPDEEAVLSKVKKSGTDCTSQPWPETEEVNVIPTLFQYKCDFCTYQSRSQVLTQSHLQQARHFSASLYQAVKADSRIKLIAVSQKLAIKNDHGKNETLAVVCPKCHDIFEDIFMCGLHYKCTHGGSTGVYSICPVIHQSMAMVAPDHTCLKCAETFLSNKQLTLHWTKNPDHHPITKKKPDVAFALYSCLYCNKTFHENFGSCKSHVICAHGSNRTSYALKVKHIMKPMRPEELPPELDEPGKDGITKDLDTLRKMKTHFKSMGGTKSKVKNINMLITNLKNAHGNLT